MIFIPTDKIDFITLMIDKNFLFMRGSIRNAVLSVKSILPQDVVNGRQLKMFI